MLYVNTLLDVMEIGSDSRRLCPEILCESKFVRSKNDRIKDYYINHVGEMTSRLKLIF